MDAKELIDNLTHFLKEQKEGAIENLKSIEDQNSNGAGAYQGYLEMIEIVQRYLDDILYEVEE